MFQIGDKVVCIDADFSMYPNIFELYRELPKRDEVYTVRERQFVQGLGYRILLDQVINQPIYIDMVKGKVEPAFNATRFALLNGPVSVEAEKMEEMLA